MPSCAVCLKPIRGATSFVLHETEVVHKVCVPFLERTVVTKLKKHALALREQRNKLQTTLRESAIEVGKLTGEFNKQFAKLKAMYEAEKTRADRAERSSASALETVLAGRDELQRRLTQAERERDAARNEAALHQTIQGAPARATHSETQQIASPDPPAEKGSDLDVRASLLELD